MLNRILGHVETIRKGIETATIRNEIISNNIANAETPGYLAKELEQTEFSKYLDSAYLKFSEELTEDKTKKNNLIDFKVANNQYEVVNQNEPMRANGNNVNLEKEMNELAKNNIAYQGMIQKVSMQFNMLEHVISDGER